jgi:hypothetical protein
MRGIFTVAVIVLACSTGCNPSPGNSKQPTVRGKEVLPATSRQEFGHESKESQSAYQASGNDTWDTANELLNQIK